MPLENSRACHSKGDFVCEVKKKVLSVVVVVVTHSPRKDQSTKEQQRRKKESNDTREGGNLWLDSILIGTHDYELGVMSKEEEKKEVPSHGKGSNAKTYFGNKVT